MTSVHFVVGVTTKSLASDTEKMAGVSFEKIQTRCNKNKWLGSYVARCLRRERNQGQVFASGRGADPASKARGGYFCNIS